MLGRPAMGYLLVISNDDDDDERELCVYPRRTHHQLANQIQQFTIWSVLLNAEFNALRAQTWCKRNDARYVDLREQKQWRRSGRQPGAEAPN